MCIVCVLWEKQKLTNSEALAALWELVREEDVDLPHLQRVYSDIEQKLRDEKQGKSDAEE